MSQSSAVERVILVTGANGAIGTAIARLIALEGDCEVVVVCRTPDKAEAARQDVQRAAPSCPVRSAVADMSRRQSIESLAAGWTGPLHVLINNAAECPRKRLETPEGIERQFATNVLGYFWMMKAFERVLKESAPSRVINVASYWAGNLDLSDLEFKHRRYSNNTAYRQAKQANRMLTIAFAERLKAFGITVNACHPGDVNSKLSNALGFGGHETPEEGAATPVWLATGDEGGRSTGLYFAHMRETRCEFARDRKGIEALYEACSRF